MRNMQNLHTRFIATKNGINRYVRQSQGADRCVQDSQVVRHRLKAMNFTLCAYQAGEMICIKTVVGAHVNHAVAGSDKTIQECDFRFGPLAGTDVPRGNPSIDLKVKSLRKKAMQRALDEITQRIILSNLSYLGCSFSEAEFIQ